MRRAAFLAWLLQLLEAAPEPTLEARAVPESAEFEPYIEVVVRGRTFRIGVEEVEA